ncbi:hypothetical protein ABXS75_03685 [Roseburia hominis]
MTKKSVDSFLRRQKESGASADCVRKHKCFITALYNWLPEGKELTADALLSWRESMAVRGYSKATVSSYVKE